MKRILKGVSKTDLWMCFLLLVGALCFVVTNPAVAAEKVIKIGACPDLSGATAETGKPFAIGLRGYFDYINKKGGINARKVEYLETDGSYDIPKETAAYKRYAMQGVVVFIGYSGGGQMQISQMCAKDKIVGFGASIAEIFADIKRAPYYFIHCATYDQVWRGLIDYAISKNPGKNLRVALVYPDNAYGHQNADMIRKRCKEKGLGIVDEEIVGFKDIDATTQMLKMETANPDLVLMPEIEPSTTVIMRDAKKVGIDTKKVQFCVPLQGMGITIIKLGGKDIEDVIGGTPFSDWSEKEVPGVNIIREFFAGKVPELPWIMHGWAAGLVASEGIRRLGNKEITGENLKQVLESMKDFDTGGITSPITFTPDNHVGGKGIKIMKPNVQKGYFEPITGWIYPK